MAGINDIREAFAKAADGIELRAVRMRYDHETNKQILEFDIVDAQGSRTITEEMPQGTGTSEMLDIAARTATALGATVTREPEAPAAPQSPLADRAAEGIAKLVGGESDAQADGPKVIEHGGETYQLAHDGRPDHLFF